MKRMMKDEKEITNGSGKKVGERYIYIKKG